MRKWLRRIGKGLLWLAAGVLVLAALPFVVLQFAAGRALVLEKGLALANESLPLRISVKSLDRLDPWGAEVQGIDVADTHGKPLAHVSTLSVGLEPFALLGGRVHLTRLSVAKAFADVPGLSAATSGPEEKKEEEQADEGGGLDIQVDELLAQGVGARVTNDERQLKAELRTLRAAGAWGSQTSLVLSALDATVSDAQGELARFATRSGNFTLAKGGHVEIAGQVADTSVLVRAEVGALRDDGSWPDGRARVEVRHVTQHTLARAGVEDLSLTRPLDLTLDARQADETFALSLKLADAARTLLAVSAGGQLDDAHAEVSLARVALAELAPELPALTVKAELRATFEGELDDAAWTARWAGVTVDENVIPDGVLRGELDESSVEIATLELSGFERSLSLEASYDWEEALAEVALALEPTELGSVAVLRQQGLSGRVRADIAFKGGSTGPLDGKADVLLERLAKAKDATLAEVRLDATVSGTTVHPEGSAKLAVKKLAAGSARVDHLSADLSLVKDQLRGAFKLLASELSMNGQLRGHQRDRTRVLDVNATGKLRDQPLRLALAASDTEQRETVASLDASLGTQKITAQGSRSANDRLNAKLDGRALDVGFWASLFGQKDVSGTIDLTASASGTTERPVLAAQVLGHDLCGMGQPETDLQLSARAEPGPRRYALTLGVYGRKDPLRIELTADAVLPKRARTSIDYLKGPFEAHAVVHVPASRLAGFDEKHLAPLRGALDLGLDASGGKGELAVQLQADAAMRLPTGDDDHQDRLKAKVAMDGERVKLDAVAHDRDGELLRMNGALEWPGGSLETATKPEAWKTLPQFRLSAKLDDRRLDMIQGVFAYLAGLYEMDMPLQVGAQVELVGEQGELSGAVNGRVMLLADVLDPSCALGTQVNSTFDMQLKKGLATLTVWARDMKGGTVNVSAEQKLTIKPEAPPESWLGATELRAEGKGIALRTLPGMCGLESGRAAFLAQASALGGRVPQAQLQLGVEDLRSGKTEPVALEVNAALGKSELSAEGQLAMQQKRRGSFKVSVPVKLAKNTFVPELGPKTPITARLDLKHLPIAPFLGIGDAVGRPSGHIDASLRVEGPLEKPKPAGFLALDDVSFTLSSSAQPLQHVNGRIEIHDNKLVVQKLVAHDGEGKLLVEGDASITDEGTGQGHLSLRADEMPLRRQGEVIGELTIHTVVDAKVPESKLAEIDMKILNGRVWLTGDTGRQVQSLEPNPDVRFVDVPQKERKEAAEEEAGDEKPKMGFASMTIRTSERDLWVMHESFSVQVGIDLRFVQEKVPVLKGEISLRRGELQILGKLFTVQRGAIRMTGDAPPDPELDIRAVHKLPSGDQLIVMVTGRSTAPQIAFGGAASNAGEAVALLSGVGRTGAESKAQDDARNFATNLTAGLLTVAARREFGDWVPVLGIENDESGAVSGARAGFDATKLIPPALRGFARAAYVEGIVGSSEASGGNVGVGVKFEVVLPADIVTSWGYGPGATWSTDVAWVP